MKILENIPYWLQIYIYDRINSYSKLFIENLFPINMIENLFSINVIQNLLSINVIENVLSINFIEILFLIRKFFKIIEQKIEN